MREGSAKRYDILLINEEEECVGISSSSVRPQCRSRQ
jgi:hypothetical protein